MRKILEDLWYGCLCPQNDSYPPTKEKKELMEYITRHHNSLQAVLTEEQKEILEKFVDCHAELSDIKEREIFVYAFQLGAKIAIDVMHFDAEEC